MVFTFVKASYANYPMKILYDIYDFRFSLWHPEAKKKYKTSSTIAMTKIAQFNSSKSLLNSCLLNNYSKKYKKNPMVTNQVFCEPKKLWCTNHKIFHKKKISVAFCEAILNRKQNWVKINQVGNCEMAWLQVIGKVWEELSLNPRQQGN